MKTKGFQFKQFNVLHNRTAMKVGTDAVLLGAWSNTGNTNNILDIGTGSGIIALMLAQRSNALIDALEIDESAAQQANENFLVSPWKEKMQLIHTSFQDFAKTTTKTYDLIVSNPPYFQNALKSPKSDRNLARHNDELSFEELINGIVKLLNIRGWACIILPITESALIKEIGISHGLYCNFETHIISRAGQQPNRLLMEFSKHKHEITISSLCILNDDLSYTEEFKSLTKDFYLNF